MKNIAKSKEVMNLISNETITFNSYDEYIVRIEEYKLLFSSYNEEELHNEVLKLKLHYGFKTTTPIWMPEEGVVVEWHEWPFYNKENALAISVFDNTDDPDSCECWSNSYILWDNTQRSDWRPWQDAEVFCRAFAALQMLAKQGQVYQLK